MSNKITPIHPGEILLEEFLKPNAITPYRLSKDIFVPAIRISEILRAKRAISADTALRFSKYFGTTAEFWLNLQAHYDLEIADEKLSKKLEHEIKFFKLTEKYLPQSK